MTILYTISMHSSDVHHHLFANTVDLNEADEQQTRRCSAVDKLCTGFTGLAFVCCNFLSFKSIIMSPGHNILNHYLTACFLYVRMHAYVY